LPFDSISFAGCPGGGPCTNTNEHAARFAASTTIQIRRIVPVVEANDERGQGALSYLRAASVASTTQ